MVHQAAAAGFARGALDYESGRPSYPTEAVAAIVAEHRIGPSSVVVDLGAGTGKFTRLLLPTGARLLAVEPVPAMRGVLASVVAGVEIVAGTGEAVPVRDASVDVVTAAQAFHWITPEAGVDELARVLRPGGGVALLWNSRDTSVGWTARIQALMDEVAGSAPRYGSENRDDWKEAFASHPAFTPLRREEFRLDHPTTLDATVARVASTSYVSALDDDEREHVLEAVRSVVAASNLGESFTEPYVTEVFLCHRR